MYLFSKHIHSPRLFCKIILKKYGRWIPDAFYLRMMFYLYTGKRLNLHNPQTFGEKLQWLKLYNRKSEYTMLVDKFAVKDYVANIIGEQYVIPTLGVWDKPEEIDWDKLPDKFVLKTTQGGGNKGVVICKNKASFDKTDAIKRLHLSLKQNIYGNFREWPYKNVKRRVIAEQFMEEDNASSEELADYKFYCFNGEPRFCQVIKDRRTRETIDFFDMNWIHQEFWGLNLTASNALKCPIRPICFDEMKAVASKLSKGLLFSRIDLYCINDKTYFGEITFFPRSGYGSFMPERYNRYLGDMIDIDIVRHK